MQKIYFIIMTFQLSTVWLAAPLFSVDPPLTRIIKGSVATEENSKFQVSIRLKRYDTIFGNGHICGGALVGLNKVLTAAHCLYNSGEKRYRGAIEFVVVMGTLNRFQRVKSTIISDVEHLVYMETFSPDTMRDDIGLMFIKTGLSPNKAHLAVAPIALRNTSTPAGTTCQVSGWGRTEWGSISPIIRIANVTTILKSVCSVQYSGALLDGMMCAGYISGGTDSCDGDSGGPLVYNNMLIGVVSWGSGCAQPGLPGIYTDVQYYYKWITEQNSATQKTSFNCIIASSAFIFIYICENV